MSPMTVLYPTTVVPKYFKFHSYSHFCLFRALFFIKLVVLPIVHAVSNVHYKLRDDEALSTSFSLGSLDWHGHTVGHAVAQLIEALR
jgi:hypothetical protein